METRCWSNSRLERMCHTSILALPPQATSSCEERLQSTSPRPKQQIFCSFISMASLLHKLLGLRNLKPQANQPVHGLRKWFSADWFNGLAGFNLDYVQAYRADAWVTPAKLFIVQSYAAPQGFLCLHEGASWGHSWNQQSRYESGLLAWYFLVFRDRMSLFFFF